MPPLVVLGPTASGKSDVAMAIATRDSTFEILAADAMQVYREMDIGTAKPTSTDQALVPHHGIDLVDPSDDFSLAQFAQASAAALRSIAARGHRALVVGGTGLYLRAVTDPMEVPPRWPALREQLERRAGESGSEELHAELAQLDPVAAARMEPTNSRRVVRALEVTLGSGRPFSSFGPGLDRYPPVAPVQFGLRWERDRLGVRIEERVHRMMRAGLLQEVERLAARPEGISRTARQALGYKELLDHLDGATGLDEAVASIVRRTRQFAVRQERWFRRDPRIRWIPIHDNPVAEALPVIDTAGRGAANQPVT